MQQTFDQELMKTRMEVQEQTLQTIASDIHDNIGQLLSLTRVSLSTVNIYKQPVKANEKIAEAMTLLDTSIKELRQLASVLHAENLLKAGLTEAVERELERLAKAGDYKTAFKTTTKKVNLPDAQAEVMVFRIIQELLNNIIKHADATFIEVEMANHSDRLQIMVKDNGKGFDTNEAMNSSKGMGLANLVKRTGLIGGELTLHSDAGTGTMAILKLPLNPVNTNE